MDKEDYSAIVLLAFLIPFVALFRWNRRQKEAACRAFSERHARLLEGALTMPNTRLIQFSFGELKAATENFSSKNYLGSGGYSDVYQGVLDDLGRVAIKRVKNCSEKGDADFVKEVTINNSVRHDNLVNVRGYCIASSNTDGCQRLLIYDFMHCGSLHNYLFHPGKPILTSGSFQCWPPVLSWRDRRRIAVEIAKGIDYLHNETRPPIIHGDIKSSSVLLDEHLNARLANYARVANYERVANLGVPLFSEEGFGSGPELAASLAYASIEYNLYAQPTKPSDVHSFGIVLLELMSGRMALDPREEGWDGRNVFVLREWAYFKVKEGSPMDIVDERIKGTGSAKIMERFVYVGISCTQTIASNRPTITEVIEYLEGDGGDLRFLIDRVR